jgi:pSer/pThr/pTyr-binding forkhead associated (FHA) protein
VAPDERGWVLPRLDLRNAEGVKGCVTITEPRFVLGRDPSCEVVLQDSTVSRRHAEILYRDGAYWIKDLGSANGTLVNGHPVDYVKLAQGDIVSLGVYSIVYHLDENEAASWTKPGKTELLKPRREGFSENDGGSPLDLQEVLASLQESSEKLIEGLRMRSMESLEEGVGKLRETVHRLSETIREIGAERLSEATASLKRKK